MSATDKQARFALDLLKQCGVSRGETITSQVARRWGVPQGDTVEETIKALSSAECSALIDRLKEALE